jgi:molybdate transport system substrate-binding protein
LARIFLLSLLSLITGANYAQRQPLLVAAASDLKFALDSVVIHFQRQHPSITVDVVYGSSGKLYEQISHGAPYDIFFSADISYPQNLITKGFTSSDVVVYGTGRIVVWSRSLKTVEGIHSINEPSVRKIAIANPQHAPYGRSAREALQHFGILDDVKGKLVYGENISQAAQFASTGAADVGILAMSLVLSPTMKKMNGRYWVIPESAHAPLEQGFVVLKGAQKKQAALQFRDFMITRTARDILAYYGFTGNIE